ncbi:MAG: PLP-dependent aminotransferase family protein [Acidobacteriota bacterium]
MSPPDTSSSLWSPTLTVDKPGYRELVQAIETDIRAGRLLPGARLPPHRELSTALGISRGTVARAYDEAQRLGLLSSGIGRGTFVADDYAVRTRQEPASEVVDFGLGFPLYELDPDPAPVLSALARDPARFRVMQYPPPGGFDAQRHAGARWCRALGVDCDAEAIFITIGAQHAAHLWLRATLQPGDTLLCAELTYRMVVSAAESRDVRVRGVAMDEEGILPEALDAAAERTGARGLFIMPTIQNTTAGVLSEARRRQVIEIAERRDLQILEDDIHGFFHEEPRPMPLQAMCPERVTYTASLSKILAGGLRVAFAVSPAARRPGYRSALLTSIYSAPALPTEVAVRWIEDGTAQATIDGKRREAAYRLDRLREVLGPLVPELRCGAYYAWMRIPEPWTATRFAMEARRRDVSVMPAEPFYVGADRPPEYIRISLGAVTRPEMESGLAVLADLASDPQAARTFFV